MKTIKVDLENAEYEQAKKKKDKSGKTWKQIVLEGGYYKK